LKELNFGNLSNGRKYDNHGKHNRSKSLWHCIVLRTSIEQKPLMLPRTTHTFPSSGPKVYAPARSDEDAQNFYK
jgi:hypothetical protein